MKINLLIPLILLPSLALSYKIELKHSNDTIFKNPFKSKNSAYLILSNTKNNKEKIESFNFNFMLNKAIVDSCEVVFNNELFRPIYIYEKESKVHHFCYLNLEIQQIDTILKLYFFLNKEIKSVKEESKLFILKSDKLPLISTNKILVGNKFYRLNCDFKDIIIKNFKDFNGNENNAVIGSEDKTVSILLSPNPSKGKFLVYYDEKNFESVKITRVVDINGNIINQLKPLSNPQQFNLDTRVSGIYYINTIFNDDTIETLPINIVK